MGDFRAKGPEILLDLLDIPAFIGNSGAAAGFHPVRCVFEPPYVVVFLAKMLTPICLIILVTPIISGIKITMRVVKGRSLEALSCIRDSCITAFVYGAFSEAAILNQLNYFTPP